MELEGLMLQTPGILPDIFLAMLLPLASPMPALDVLKSTEFLYEEDGYGKEKKKEKYR